ncbi:MAG TPA: TetR/AcrR family transcriptional regulator [Solirubrobacterales bacterium]|nr:TetR/AcrR family transcriptional regulator [Solirubrobacterales bacterium]
MAVEHQESLRERKKQKTRETIARVALDLFAKNGYQRTTIAQIAEAADVSPRTVSTYFPAKEAIVFDLNGDMKERLAEALRGRPAGENTMEALRSWILSERKFWETHEEQLSCQRQVIEGDDGLIAYERAQIHEFEVLLVEALAVDLELEPDDLEPRMAASAAVAVFDLLSTEKRPEVKSEMLPVEEQMKIFDQALTFVVGGVNALREARGT